MNETLPPLAITRVAPAKINLCLRVVERLDNGYHHLDMLVGFAESAGDSLSLSAVKAGEQHILFELEGRFAEDLRHEDARLNLVSRAAHLMQKAVADLELALPRGALLHLNKNLPVASGIGGGSADAAAVIIGLENLWGIKLPENKKLALALELGADVPMCLFGRAAHVSGIGEAIAPLPYALPGWFLLVNPQVRVSTRAVFEALDLSQCGGAIDFSEADFADAAALANCLQTAGNHLQTAAIGIAPVIADCLEMLNKQKGCLAAQMTGSGATCFGLFNTEAEAIAAQKTIADFQPAWWQVVSKLR